MKEYLRRIVDKELQLRLEAFGATLIVGPKWCGKTTTAEEQAKSILKMQDPDMREGYLATANAKPSLLLKGENPRLIDEWQEAPVLWDAVRTAVDQRQEEGLFILTGSTSVDEKQIHHTGTGRISRLKMYTMSLFESGESNGRISLKELFDNQNMDIDGISSEMRIDDLIFAACRGGWPSSLRKKSDAAKLIVARDYLRNVYESDVSTVDGVRRNPTLAETVLKSYARNVSTLAKKSIIFKDIAANSESVSAPTLDSYLNALERLFVIEDIEAWCPAIRSATTIRAGKKRGFVDPSMAVAALGLTPEYLEKDLKTFGFIFECMCIRDLKIYSQALNGKVSYYHDRYDLEADAVLHIADGRYALIEFKLGGAEIDEGAKHLLKIRELVRAYNKAEKQVPLREPDLLMVITGGSMAYTREDGVKVIPIACLKD
ncbi:MAG: ATP-binding protein [Lachnospiraceae bacterium]|nr:ATP-binding protein [Lachnospiraceae bacterium]